MLAFPVQPTPERDVFSHGRCADDAPNTTGSRVSRQPAWPLQRSRGDATSDDNRSSSRPTCSQLTNTRYFLTNIPELPFIGNTTLVKGPVRNASGDTVYLYRLNAENPYSWVTPVAVKAPDDQVLATLLNPRFDVRRAALFDSSANVAVSPGVQTLPPPAGDHDLSSTLRAGQSLDRSQRAGAAGILARGV